ncbi:conserved Plasmodium protein, unknown function [Plasmodium knowlesi strain H]|uniref:Uncharacterized protein n=3 Tax=Plasmodium knowlesi TaxID=5850 RepID=A0A5K1VJV5_PLAKH|nr:conserved Plasmodium protein, unknown function [Plasmodium knowlesi strain H]OTN64186.1 Uncharacterized protein PKNOH_S140281400 [Plasmodium knowlesi]CAA9991224.1 conserved Plasmodium protein, unknown function [Plasmodium knowlesi strain H]SBO26293.1 conserved Plasmodium protein, unknown function [Plasmodium knowlesi strain H]SBO29575.1 conserved Plasmodium protein, unknown function [Plasmodium knowlesi strain H]VVS80698.1 conserved Plasmodium protein, unknown function [Plasmodium knowlesi |eukprot:XP_002262506.1 hypothetical protein, conserved in Plasmodium species [Plasmodium knowlesi strain H]
MKDATWHHNVRHCYVDNIPFLKNVEGPHRFNIKDQVEKYERKKKNIKREIYKFISGIGKGYKPRHHMNYNLGVLCRKSTSHLNMSSLSTQYGGTINGYAGEVQRGCSIFKKGRNYKKKISLYRDYENEVNLGGHNFLWNSDAYHESRYQNYLHMFIKSKELDYSSIFDEYNYRRRVPAFGMFQSDGHSHLGGRKLYREVHQNNYKGRVGPRWRDSGDGFPTCGVIASGLSSPGKSMKLGVQKRAMHRQNRSSHQRSSSSCSNESTKIIDQFVKSIERNHSGEKEKGENMDWKKVNFCAVLSENDPLHGMSIPKSSIPNCYSITRKDSKTHGDYQEASTVLLQYEQIVKDNRKMLNLLQRVMHQIEMTGSSEINKKIEKGIIMYLKKVERMMRKYKEALKCDDFSKSRRLYRHFRTNEIVMLRCVLNYVIDLMRHVKYECKDLRREIEREICEVELAIWQTLGQSPPSMRHSA